MLTNTIHPYLYVIIKLVDIAFFQVAVRSKLFTGRHLDVLTLAALMTD